MEPLISIKDLTKHFDISGGLLDQLKWQNGRIERKRTVVKAVSNVSFDILPGETLSVVGESGCGKSTLGRAVVGIHELTSGTVHYRGQRIDNLSAKEMIPHRRKMQMVFQDPYASLNPRMTVRQTLSEPYKFHTPGTTRSEIKARVWTVMEQVGLDASSAENFPHEFSGGQRQRISLARALMIDPEFIVADEPIAALDVSIQAQILNLMMDAQADRKLTYLFISHDLSVIKHISTRVMVMYLGHICELAKVQDLFDSPRHPYTQALLSAIPQLTGKRKNHIKLSGDVPTPINLPPGCVFSGRCPNANERCRTELPSLITCESGRQIACHGVEEGRI